MSERGKRLYLVVGGRVVYSGRVRQKVLDMRDEFWPDAVLTDEPPKGVECTEVVRHEPEFKSGEVDREKDRD